MITIKCIKEFLVHGKCSINISCYFNISLTFIPSRQNFMLPCSSWFSMNGQNFFSIMGSLLDTTQRSEKKMVPVWPDQLARTKKCLNFYHWKCLSLGKTILLQVCSPIRFNFHKGKEHSSVI